MLEWLKPYVSAQSPESPKALVLWQSAAVLCFVFGLMGVCVSFRIAWTGKVEAAVVTLLLGLAGIVGGLAGFHKQEDPKPPAGGA